MKMDVTQKYFVLFLSFILFTLLTCIHLSTVYLRESSIKVLIFAGNVQNQFKPQCINGTNRTNITSTGRERKFKPVSRNTTRVYDLPVFNRIPDLSSSAHPFHHPHYLDNFIGHIYRRYLQENRTASSKSNQYEGININAYKDYLKRKASTNNTVILVTVDKAYVAMAINLFESSFKKFNITNYIFTCSEPEATKILTSLGIDAVTFWTDVNGREQSNYGSKEFNRKTRYKTVAATVALEMGFKVLLMDVDIVFLKNPLPYLTCNSCDIILQSEGTFAMGNTGFYLAFPTNNTYKLHILALDSYKLSDSFNDQDAIHHIIAVMKKEDNLQIKFLNRTQFPNGNYYFDKGCRMFSNCNNSCEDCVIVHNNDIITYDNKIYRFKEHLMWTIDKDRYYSDEEAKYLTYQNAFTLQSYDETRHAELLALKTAFMIGSILNRIVILPKFRCPLNVLKSCPGLEEPGCPAYMTLNISALNEHFYGKYREHSFLRNNKVPLNVKNSISDTIFTNSSDNIAKITKFENVKKSERKLYLRDSSTGATVEEFRSWMKKYDKYSVIRFHSLLENLIESNEFVVINYKISKLML